MFLPLWAPSRLSFSLINSRPPQSNRCYGSNPSKLKKKNRKPKAKALHNCSTYWQPARRGTLWVRTGHMENRVPPSHHHQYPLCRKDSPVTVAPQVPRLPKQSLSNSVRLLHWQLSGQFQSFLHRSVFIVSVVWHHFFFFRVARVATRHLPSLTLLQLKWLYKRVTTEANMFFLWKLKNAGFLKSAFLWKS